MKSKPTEKKTTRFYANLERLCRLNDTTPNAAAIAIGRARGGAANWKANGNIPPEDDLIKLAELLHCEPGDFFRDPEKPFFSGETEAMEWEWRRQQEEAAASFGDLDDNEAELLRIYNACSKKQRANLMALVFGFEEEEGL